MNRPLFVSTIANVVLLLALGISVYAHFSTQSDLALAHDTLNTTITTSHGTAYKSDHEIKKKDRIIEVQQATLQRQLAMIDKQIHLTTGLEEWIVQHTYCLPTAQKKVVHQLLDDIKASQISLHGL